MAMRYEGTRKRLLPKPTVLKDAHPYMSHHSFYASKALRKKRAKRQQQEERRGETDNMVKHYQTYNAAVSTKMEDREFSTST